MDENNKYLAGFRLAIAALLLLQRLLRRPVMRKAHPVGNYLAPYYSSEAGYVPWQEQQIYPRGRPAHV